MSSTGKRPRSESGQSHKDGSAKPPNEKRPSLSKGKPPAKKETKSTGQQNETATASPSPPAHQPSTVFVTIIRWTSMNLQTGVVAFNDTWVEILDAYTSLEGARHAVQQWMQHPSFAERAWVLNAARLVGGELQTLPDEVVQCRFSADGQFVRAYIREKILRQ